MSASFMAEILRLPGRYPGVFTLISHQAGDIVFDEVTGEAGMITANSVLILKRLNEMHATAETINRIAAEVDRRSAPQATEGPRT